MRDKIVPMSADRAGLAMEAILGNRYFELTRGANGLRAAIFDLDAKIRYLSPWYRITLSDQEPADTALENFRFYVFLKEGKLHYKTKEYDNSISSGELHDKPAFPNIVLLPKMTDYSGHFDGPKPNATLLTQNDTLYFYAVEQHHSDKLVGKKIMVAWKDTNGEIHSKWLQHYEDVKEPKQYQEIYSRLEKISCSETLTDSAEQKKFFDYPPLVRSMLSEFGTKKLVSDLSAHQCDRAVTLQEEEIIRRQFGLLKYRCPHSYEGGEREDPDLTSEIHCVAVLRERLQAVELADLKILTDLVDFTNNGLVEIQKQQKSNSSFKTQLTDCKSKIEKIFSSSTHQHANVHRSDIKIHRIVQALVDAYNEIKDSKKGRSFAGLWGGSKTALQIETLLQTIQQKLSDYPNYAFTLKRIENEKIELKWTEEFKDDDAARLAITSGHASTLRIK